MSSEEKQKKETTPLLKASTLSTTSSSLSSKSNDEEREEEERSILNRVLIFIDGGSRTPSSKPGFAHSLKTSYHTIDKSGLSLGERGGGNTNNKTLVYRYKFCDKVSKPTLGLLSALQDDLGTVALFRVGQPSTPGVSLQMQTEFLKTTTKKTLDKLNNMKEMDIVNVVSKLGKTISYTKTYFNYVATGETFAYSTHVKYMPIGIWILDIIITSKFWFFFLYKLVTYFYPQHSRPIYEQKELFKEVVGNNLEHHSIGHSTFHVTNFHLNPTGAMHGGCIAMVIEQAGIAYVKSTWKEVPKADSAPENNFILTSMQIEYPSAVKQGTKSVNVVCETLSSDDESCVVRVLLKRGDRITSDGLLRFSKLVKK